MPKNVDVPTLPPQPAHQTAAVDISDLQLTTIGGGAIEAGSILSQLCYETGIASELYTSKGNASPEYAAQIAKMRELTAQLKRLLAPVLSL
jgi:hypothetical protein